MRTIEVIAALKWYQSNVNNGRGKFTSELSFLVKQGYVSIRWTSVNTWSATISQKGLDLLKQT